MRKDAIQTRRGFIGAAAAFATGIGSTGPAAAHLSAAGIPDSTTRTRAISASLEPLKQINAGLLKVGYTESGPVGGPAILLLHGWPYDIDSFAEVVPLLTAKVIASSCPICAATVPPAFFQPRPFERSAIGACGRHHRADGRTEDREGSRRRIRLGRAHRQHHGGALAAARQRDGLRQRLPDRQPGGRQNAALAEGEHEWWYQYYFATERGRIGYENTAASSRS